jgi:hypothetical protein
MVRGVEIGVDIRVIFLSEFQRLCRLNANEARYLVDETTGAELNLNSFSVDRALNRIVSGISVEYSDPQNIITHQRINDFKESGGRKIFKDVETLEMLQPTLLTHLLLQP